MSAGSRCLGLAISSNRHLTGRIYCIESVLLGRGNQTLLEQIRRRLPLRSFAGRGAARIGYSRSTETQSLIATQQAKSSAVHFLIKPWVDGTCAANALSRDPAHPKLNSSVTLALETAGRRLLRGEAAGRLHKAVDGIRGNAIDAWLVWHQREDHVRGDADPPRHIVTNGVPIA